LRNTFIASLLKVAEENPRVWLLCGDLGFSVLEPFVERFPARYLNVGVAEQNMAGIAAGIALSGMTVFIYSIGNFPTLRCLEQIRNDICYHGADVKVVAVGAGFAYGSQGYTHHALEDVGIMSMLPGMEVFVPSDPGEVEAATRLIAASGRPSYLRLSRSGEPRLGAATYDNPRRARILRRGRTIMILAAGPIASHGLAAAAMLAENGVDVGVASLPCVKPFDEEFLNAVAGDAQLLVSLEEHVLRGGLFATVAAALASRSERPRLLGLGVPEPAGKISLSGDREAQLAAAGLRPEDIAARIRHALGP
jgi:transketolase